jgi:hypothetical protein
MSNRNFDASQLIKRKGERAIAGSFLNRINPPTTTIQPQQGSAPINGIFDSSIMNAVRTGHMTEYTRYPTCVVTSPGCPSLQHIPSSIPPGPVTGITFGVGSIILSWNPPTTGDGIIIYRITPYINGIAQTPVTTTSTTYRFTNIQEFEPYTFTVCAMNSGGQGPIVPSPSYFLAPPDSLSSIMSGNPATVNTVSALKYVINTGLDNLLQYATTNNLGPTKGSRFMYVWIASVAQAWNWVRSESRISETHDAWNWDQKVTPSLLDNDSIIWLCNVIDYITPYFITSGYQSIYNCPADVVARVKTAGNWNSWVSAWQTWFNYRVNDGNVAAATTQPDSTQNLNTGNSIIIDGTTVTDISNFPAPSKWAPLWLKNYSGASQKYMTYGWDNVLSTCLTDLEEAAIQINPLYQPLTGTDRDTEIDAVKNITAGLTDAQKCCAEFWAGGPGTVSPPLMFIWFWKEYMRTAAVNDIQNIIYSLLDLAIHLFEGGRVTWRLKAANMEARPIQEIRRRYAGQTIASWNGQVNGSQWIPYQTANFVTPPFADFPSGHSHFSTAFALTMTKWFGPNITKSITYYDKQTLISPLFKLNATQPYGTFTIGIGKSEVQPDVVPNAPIVLSFNTWDDMSSGTLGAGPSRLYGGIHCSSANTASQEIASDVDTLINSSWNIQTSINNNNT